MIKKSKLSSIKPKVKKDIEKKSKEDKKIVEKIIKAHSSDKHNLVDRAPLYHILDDIRKLIDEKPVDRYTFRNIEVALRKTISKVQDADK